MRYLFLILLMFSGGLFAQLPACSFKPPSITIHFGTGDVRDLNQQALYAYTPVGSSCPSDGHYTYVPYTSDCFGGDWITLTEDHTPGDVSGNMMLVNASYRNGEFLNTKIPNLKGGMTYQFSVWMINVCRITEKCPFPLLPNITIRLETLDGKTVASMETGQVQRQHTPKWTEYKFTFTTLPSENNLILSMTDNIPGGCGNDFAVDDITFSECVRTPPPKIAAKKPVPQKKITPKSTAKAPPVASTVKPKPAASNPPKKSVTKSPAPVTKAPVKKPSVAKTPPPKPAAKSNTQNDVARRPQSADAALPKADGPAVEKSVVAPAADTSAAKPAPPIKKPKLVLPPPPAAIANRNNEVYRKIQTGPGEIRIDLYDNGEIDGDTVTIYHNNRLEVSKAKLSAKPITLRLSIDPENPHHELVMVANNLGSIPPNTSLMVVTAGDKRYEVFISSNEQKNAKVIFDLKE